MIDDLLSEEDARTHLEPHLEAIRGCIEDGWAEWHRNVQAAPSLALTSKTSRANVVYDHISSRMEAYFDQQGVPTSRKRGFLTVSLADGVIEVRAKKFAHRHKLTTSGIPTYQRLAMLHQQVPLDGLAVTHITVGYFPDELGVGLDVVAVACSYGRELVWWIDLRADGTAAANPVPLVSIDSPDEGPSVRSTRKPLEVEEGMTEAQ
ncbi:hypothetical protein J2X85_001597 [Microbacterium trichothecenolyticum]|uniref:hypothetical protein n=1 Tax=Microbacterium trichothecenolyticum TaxID=69370 RepID=UPI002856CFCC|nr:hypothetical protein [Microbacterium trichothecenolyticum]MDR7184574.1 hypothetical protein [Microbacterium trichothecenolyticum]